MRGYFGQPELTARAFLRDDDGDRLVSHRRPRRRRRHGCFTFHGRRDRMVKKRGYRIELGEIESALYRHDGVDRGRGGRQGRRRRASRSPRSSR